MTFQPKRGDEVAEWLKRKRDESYGAAFVVVDDLLDEYRERADYGLSLDADMSDLPQHS